jgi:GNAT superfamily N-acetyltransferase
MATTAESREVRIATKSEEDSILAVLTLAFSADPGVRWYFPAPPTFYTYFPEFSRAYGGKAFDHEAAYYVGEYVGAALWLPPEVEPDTDEIVGVMQAALSEDKLMLLDEFIERVEKSHPSEPFWELTVLGVDPIQQRNGYGNPLMEPVLEECDHKGTPAFLISSNIQNLSFYLRHGFEIVDTIQLPTMPPFFPMRRKPQR